MILHLCQCSIQDCIEIFMLFDMGFRIDLSHMMLHSYLFVVFMIYGIIQRVAIGTNYLIVVLRTTLSVTSILIHLFYFALFYLPYFAEWTSDSHDRGGLALLTTNSFVLPYHYYYLNNVQYLGVNISYLCQGYSQHSLGLLLTLFDTIVLVYDVES